MESSNKVVTLQREDRRKHKAAQLRGPRQTPCEGRFGAHVLKKRALRHSPQNKGGTADNVRPLSKDGFFNSRGAMCAGQKE